MATGAARLSLANGSMLDLEHVEHTDVGRVRDHNEDYSGSALPASEAEGRTHGWLFVVASSFEISAIARHSSFRLIILCYFL